MKYCADLNSHPSFEYSFVIISISFAAPVTTLVRISSNLYCFSFIPYLNFKKIFVLISPYYPFDFALFVRDGGRPLFFGIERRDFYPPYPLRLFHRLPFRA